MADKLKPCPFCGGGQATAYMDNYGKVMVSCDICGAALGVELEIGVELVDGWRASLETEAAAIVAWNRRAEPAKTGHFTNFGRITDNPEALADQLLICDGRDFTDFCKNLPECNDDIDSVTAGKCRKCLMDWLAASPKEATDD